ncbi:MAG: hypothetical protein QOK17_1561 [Sphingomonadales bacterium]|jgi:hypothetical protein|nr:hypothetical protein [Sphingomonadales bacterium]
MPRLLKVLIGLTAMLLMGWIWHVPAGRGEAYVARLEAGARAAIAPIGIPGVEVRLPRDPLRRTAILSGTADDVQREGLGSEMGLSDYVRAVPGIAGVHWADQPGGPGGLPLLAETLLQLLFAYALGFGIGAIFFARPKRQSFLD